MEKKIYYFISLDYEVSFLTESLEELKNEIKTKHWDDDALPFMVQVDKHKVLDLSFGELYIGEENSDECFDPIGEVSTEDDCCMLDKNYILKH